MQLNNKNFLDCHHISIFQEFYSGSLYMFIMLCFMNGRQFIEGKLSIYQQILQFHVLDRIASIPYPAGGAKTTPVLAPPAH